MNIIHRCRNKKDGYRGCRTCCKSNKKCLKKCMSFKKGGKKYVTKDVCLYTYKCKNMKRTHTKRYFKHTPGRPRKQRCKYTYICPPP